MADDTDCNLPRLGVCKIQNALITHADAPAVAILEFLAEVWKGVVFKGKNCVRNARLHLGRQAGEFLPGVARNFNLPVHTPILSSLSA